MLPRLEFYKNQLHYKNPTISHFNNKKYIFVTDIYMNEYFLKNKNEEYLIDKKVDTILINVDSVDELYEYFNRNKDYDFNPVLMYTKQ